VNRRKPSEKSPVKQGLEEAIAEPNEIGAGSTFDFEAKNLTCLRRAAAGSGDAGETRFQQLVEETLTVKRAASARKTSRWVDKLKAAHWQRSPPTDADGQCEFWYQPEGWPKAYRFIALRWRPRSGATQAESVSATAITMPGQECAGLADGRGYPVHSAVCGTTRRQW